MDVIGVGIATIDVIHEVAAYPDEDSKTRSLASRKCRGGNVANALAVCAQLGGRCRWLGMSTDPEKDSDAAFVHADLSDFGVDCSLASIESEGSMPVSFIMSSRATGSRTIVNSRNLPELSYTVFVNQLHQVYRNDIQTAPIWLHFEGRNMGDTEQMMLYVRNSVPAAKISVEIEALRNDWTSAMNLVSVADYVFMSKDYLREKLGFPSADRFFKAVLMKQWGEGLTKWTKAFICPWGTEGVYYLDMAGPVVSHIAAISLDKVVETVGAGDSFIGASLAGLSKDNAPLDLVLKAACGVASTKCSRYGFALPDEAKMAWQEHLQHREDRTVARTA